MKGLFHRIVKTLFGKCIILLTLYPIYKISDWSKFKELAVDPKRLKFVLGRVENIFRKCWLPAFSPFSKIFSKLSLLMVIKS